MHGHRVVGHHHRARPEEGLEVVGQLRATGVARVHRDEDRACRVERQVGSLEKEARDALGARALDREDLLRDHAEHLRGVGLAG